jgi:hypothetical protein
MQRVAGASTVDKAVRWLFSTRAGLSGELMLQEFFVQ